MRFELEELPFQLTLYDDIINKPSNDWDLYYWMTGASPIPDEFNNDVMTMMVEHAKNTRMEVRISQPPLVRADFAQDI